MRTGSRLAGVGAAVALAFAGLMVSAGTADAVSAKVRKACAADYKRLCPSYKVGSTQLRACMESMARDISSRCIDALIDSGEVDRRRAGR